MIANRTNGLRTTIAHPNAVKAVGSKTTVRDGGVELGELKVKI